MKPCFLMLAAGLLALPGPVMAHPGHAPSDDIAAPTPIAITPDALAGLPREVIAFDDHGSARSCEGPALASLLEAGGYPQGTSLRGAALAQGIMVEAEDGYRVLLSLGEIDPLLGKARAILATQCDGASLDAETGPVRLVIADDDRPARAVRQVVRIVPVMPDAD